MLTDQLFHNIGIGFDRSASAKTAAIEADEQHEGEVITDLGRYEVTRRTQDKWRYRTPTLRNITLTAPYMHDGSMASLKDVISHYMRAESDDPNLDPRIKPFVLSNAEVNQLVIFLTSLTSLHIDELIEDAPQVPIGDT